MPDSSRCGHVIAIQRTDELQRAHVSPAIRPRCFPQPPCATSFAVAPSDLVGDACCTHRDGHLSAISSATQGEKELSIGEAMLEIRRSFLVSCERHCHNAKERGCNHWHCRSTTHQRSTITPLDCFRVSRRSTSNILSGIATLAYASLLSAMRHPPCRSWQDCRQSLQ